MRPDTELLYSKEHEWIRVEGDEGTIGISDYAQSELSDVVYVDLPEVGQTVSRGDAVATVESVKAASDVYTPVSGVVLEVNEALDDSPELVNKDPLGEAWLFRVRLSDPSELDDLLDAQAYQAFLATLH